MPADYERIHDLEREEHYVYRLLGARGRVLYIGCSMVPDKRIAEHRRNGRFGHLVGATEQFGPYSYQEGRAVEAAWISAEQPPFNTEHTHREQRGVSLARRAA